MLPALQKLGYGMKNKTDIATVLVIGIMLGTVGCLAALVLYFYMLTL